jgi:glutathione synthase/RimK-type ligase-like ATP-grasp enzyme
MILLCGIQSEPSLGLVIDAVRELGVDHVLFHQREFARVEMQLQIDARGVKGWMHQRGKAFRLEDFTAVYTRLMDHNLLPEVESQPPDSPVRLHCAAIHDTLMRWFEIMPGLVLNRASEIGSNLSKPYQAQLIRRQGFAVPETLVTNDPELVRDFRRKHGRVIYKSVSYIRSVVKILEDSDLDRLSSVRTCPTQFQQYIDGANVRVHAVGRETFATTITAKTTDYRYAYLEGESERLEAMQLSDDFAGRCIALSRALNLGFAGIDLKIARSGEVYCLEVNPCPAFSYYQLHTGQPIAAAVARYLAGKA